MREYREVLKVAPDHVQANLELGSALTKNNQIGEAETYFQHVVELTPENSAAHLGLAECARRQGDSTIGRRHAEEALRLAGTSSQRAAALAELGQAFLDERQSEGAVNCLREAVRLAPAEGSIRHTLASALSLAGKTDEARAEREQAVQIRDDYNRLTEITNQLLTSPHDAELRTQAGLILIRHGMADEGARWLLTAIDCDSQHRGAHQALAEYFAGKGEIQLAARHRLLAARAATRPVEHSLTPTVRDDP
jgi:Flp pilus assembly protein TadD